MAAFGQLLTPVLACFAGASVVVIVLDGFALPAKARRVHARPLSARTRMADIAARLLLIALVYAVFFSISWRPIYSFAGTVSTFAIFTLISRAKFEYIREPLIFSDIALVMLVFKHKEMFYASWLNIAFWVVAFGYVFGASTAFFLVEPSILPQQGRALAITTLIVATIAPWLMLLSAPVREYISRIAARIVGKDEIGPLTVRLGTFGAVMSGFLAWLGSRPSPKASEDLAEPPATRSDAGRPGKGKPLIVVWQSESFIDMRHFGMDAIELPNLDRLRQRAAAWGRMSSIFEGGYTLRTEFSVISGLPPSDLGPDAAYPYLNAGTYTDIAWPSRFRRAGWTTRFLHPYDRDFFSRHRALPLLGFEELTMLDAFDHDREHEGPYVSDMTLSKRLLRYVNEDGDWAGQLLFAASMENHGPWKPGRQGDSDDPVDIYTAILQRSDAALGYLADELDRLERPVWLAFYGDHAPILKAFADPFPDPRTDYVIVPLARAANRGRGGVPSAERAPWNILSDVVRLGGFQPLLAEAA